MLKDIFAIFENLPLLTKCLLLVKHFVSDKWYFDGIGEI